MSGIGSFAAAQLKPDSFARFVVGADEWSYFIEVDRSTEGSRTIARKLDSYVTYHRQGSEQAEHGVFPKVQWLTADAERVAVIEAEIARLPLQARKLFGVCEFDNALHTFIGDANPNPHTI